MARFAGGWRFLKTKDIGCYNKLSSLSSLLRVNVSGPPSKGKAQGIRLNDSPWRSYDRRIDYYIKQPDVIYKAIRLALIYIGKQKNLFKDSLLGL